MVGLWRIARSAPERQAEVWVNTGLFVLGFTLAGARLAYVWMNRDYFAAHLIEAPQIWLGGLAWEGAVGAAGFALVYLGFRFRASRSRATGVIPIPLGWLGDRLYPLLPPLAITTWLGCWQIGVAYGVSLPAGAFGGVPSLDEYGLYSLRFPLQPLAALTLLVFFVTLEMRLKPLRPAGRLSGLAISGLLLHLLVTSLLRADPAPYRHGLRVDTWMAIIYLALFLMLAILNILVLYIGRKSPFPKPEQISS